MSKALEYFKSKFVKSEGCWNWTGFFNRGGYGQFGISNGGPKKTVRAHRYSWLVHRGPIPEGLNVLHKCDNPACVNPDHLFLGTQKDNVDDMMRKGRCGNLKGQEHARSKMTDAIVIQARKERASGAEYRALAIKYGVCLRTMAMALTGETWKHLPGAIPAQRPGWNNSLRNGLARRAGGA